jgi:hypothetical protein
VRAGEAEVMILGGASMFLGYDMIHLKCPEAVFFSKQAVFTE